MTDDRRPADDEFSEYGSLFEASPPTGQMPNVGTPDEPQGYEDDPPASWDDDDDGIGDVTWADDLQPAIDSTSTSDYQAPVPGDDSYGAGRTGDVQSTNVFEVDDISRADHLSGVGAFDGSGGLAFDDDDPSAVDVDVWSSFNPEPGEWQDQSDPSVETVDPSPVQPRRVVIGDVDAGDRASVGRHGSSYQSAGRGADGRIAIGTDPSGAMRADGRDLRDGPGRAGADPRRPRRSADQGRSTVGSRAADNGGRDMPMAIAVGVALAAVFVAALTVDQLKYWAIVGLVTAVVAIAAFEFYGRVADKGYRPAVVPGMMTCIIAPLVAYWMGDAALPLVIAFGFIAVAVTFIGARSVESGPMPNISITTLGMIWIGLLGSFAMLILRFSTANATDVASSVNYGTDTLFLLALGVVVNDTGALLVGSFVGRTPLRPWISPNKTVEGLIGGTAFTIVALIVAAQVNTSSTWNNYRDLLFLALVISVMAPLGDLVESMLKRNMDIKDFGSIVRGHGGVLDRFDGFLFVLPAVYYLTEVLQPWTRAG